VPDPSTCVFCASERERVLDGALVYAVRDAYPVARGHTLVISKRHVATYFEASTDERAAIWAAVEQVKAELDATLEPDGYNVGFNAGLAAGQTIMHLHVHVIPRVVGDVDDPRGGVRGVIPSRQKYGP
jgi:diadenosine tetraphosphate (Ap4A) HIT family hydrolase